MFCSLLIAELSPEQQQEVFLLDSQLSPVLYAEDASYVDVTDWFRAVNLDNVVVLVMAYHEK